MAPLDRRGYRRTPDSPPRPLSDPSQPAPVTPVTPASPSARHPQTLGSTALLARRPHEVRAVPRRNDEDARFCDDCGIWLELVCPRNRIPSRVIPGLLDQAQIDREHQEPPA